MGKVVGLVFNQTRQSHICPDCGREYKTKDGLEKHIEEKHTPVQDT